MKKKILLSLIILLILLSTLAITGCGTSDKESNKLDDTPIEKNKVLNCSTVADKKDGDLSYKEEWRAKYDFIYDETIKDYMLDSVYKELTIPKEIKNVKAYYNIKSLAALEFETEIKDDTIIFNIDRDSKSWERYIYSDYNYDELKERLLDIGYICK